MQKATPIKNLLINCQQVFLSDYLLRTGSFRFLSDRFRWLSADQCLAGLLLHSPELNHSLRESSSTISSPTVTFTLSPGANPISLNSSGLMPSSGSPNWLMSVISVDTVSSVLTEESEHAAKSKSHAYD